MYMGGKKTHQAVHSQLGVSSASVLYLIEKFKGKIDKNKISAAVRNSFCVESDKTCCDDENILSVLSNRVVSNHL